MQPVDFEDHGLQESSIMGMLSVLGLTPIDGMAGAAARPGTSADGSAKTLPIWAAAKEQVGAQIAALQSSLRATKDPLLLAIADKGLHGLTQKLQVGLHVAAMEFDAAAADGRAKLRPKLLGAIVELRSFVQSHPALPLLEKNPFGVQVTIRDSLGTALDAMERTSAA